MSLDYKMKLIIYDLYSKDYYKQLRYNFNDFFNKKIDSHHILKKFRIIYYKKAIILLRKEKIKQLKNKLK